MKRIVYADGFHGFLTACSKLVNAPVALVEFQAEKDNADQLGLFDTANNASAAVKVDEQIVQQFIGQIIEKIGQNFLVTLDSAFRHNLAEKETYCFHALHLGFQHGPKVLQFKQDIKVARFLKLAQAVNFEIHRFYGFTRFKEHAESRFLYARISPKFDILEPLALYFRVRLNSVAWLLATDTQCALWDQKQLFLGRLSSPIRFDADDSIEELWQQYYRATTNLQRWNWRVFQNHLPIYYQKYMPEKQVIQTFQTASGEEF